MLPNRGFLTPQLILPVIVIALLFGVSGYLLGQNLRITPPSNSLPTSQSQNPTPIPNSLSPANSSLNTDLISLAKLMGADSITIPGKVILKNTKNSTLSFQSVSGTVMELTVSPKVTIFPDSKGSNTPVQASVGMDFIPLNKSVKVILAKYTDKLAISTVITY